MSEKIIKLSDDSYQEQTKSGVVLVYFWAEWCGPCKMIAPILDEAAEEFDGKLTVAKLNVDQNPESPAKNGVRGIPTLILYKDGKKVDQKVGALSKTELKKFINEHV
jgi:thioredoxin 1